MGMQRVAALLILRCSLALAVETAQSEDSPLFPWQPQEAAAEREDDGDEEASAPWADDNGAEASRTQPQALRGSLSLLERTETTREAAAQMNRYMAEAGSGSGQMRMERRVATEVQAERAERSQSRAERQMLRDMGRLEAQLEAAQASSEDARQKLADSESALQSERAERAIALHGLREAEDATRHNTMFRFVDAAAFVTLIGFLVWTAYSYEGPAYSSQKGRLCKGQPEAEEMVPGIADFPKADFAICSPDRDLSERTPRSAETRREPPAITTGEGAVDVARVASDKESRGFSMFKPSPEKCDAEAQVDFGEPCSTVATPRFRDSEEPLLTPRLITSNMAPCGLSPDSMSTPPKCEVYSLVDGSRYLAKESDAREMLSGCSESGGDDGTGDDASCMTEEDRWWTDAAPSRKQSQEEDSIRTDSHETMASSRSDSDAVSAT